MLLALRATLRIRLQITVFLDVIIYLNYVIEQKFAWFADFEDKGRDTLSRCQHDEGSCEVVALPLMSARLGDRSSFQ